MNIDKLPINWCRISSINSMEKHMTFIGKHQWIGNDSSNLGAGWGQKLLFATVSFCDRQQPSINPPNQSLTGCTSWFLVMLVNISTIIMTKKNSDHVNKSMISSKTFVNIFPMFKIQNLNSSHFKFNPSEKVLVKMGIFPK